jgi:hypothetical protein
MIQLHQKKIHEWHKCLVYSDSYDEQDVENELKTELVLHNSLYLFIKNKRHILLCTVLYFNIKS